ncbi:hypothetical protein EII17_09890 [Clostridiales bacterium COT073_COT-073]|nr:hypothetical protein EII17_09890 [Clostridiales bacterium COT073_COT-073]
MNKKRKEHYLILLFLVMLLFQIKIWAQSPNDSTASEIKAESVNPAQAEIQSATENSEAEASAQPETQVENEQDQKMDNSGETKDMTWELKGSTEPDKATKDILDTILAAPYMPIDILVGDQYLLTSTDAFSFYGIIYTPLRPIIDLVQGSTLSWDQEDLRADITLPLNGGVKSLSFFANSTFYLNDGVLTSLPSATLQKDGKMMIPLNFMTDLLGITMEYDSVYHFVNLNLENVSINPAVLEHRFYGPEELKAFSRLIYKEAGGTTYKAMHAVASVVLNHVRHPLYSNTLSGVIFATAPSGAPHYTPAHKPEFASVIPNYTSVLAAKWVLRGENSIGQAIYFNTRPFKNKTILTKINGIYFCY